MPRPLPDYIPDAIRDVILKRYPRGIKQLAEHIGKPYVTVLEMLKLGKHRSLQTWLEFAESLGQDPDELTKLLELPDDERCAAYLAITRKQTVLQSINEYESSMPYTYGVLRGELGKQVKELYLPFARAIDVKLAELPGMLT